MTNNPWFRAKRLGYGAGLPIRWQGWVVMLGMAAGVGATELWLSRSHPLLAALLVGLIVAVTLGITSRHTEGGPWRWRS